MPSNNDKDLTLAVRLLFFAGLAMFLTGSILTLGIPITIMISGAILIIAAIIANRKDQI